MDNSAVPPQRILDLIRRGRTPGALTPVERSELQRWVAVNQGSADPAWISGVNAVLTGEAPPAASTTAPGGQTPAWDTPDNNVSPLATGAPDPTVPVKTDWLSERDSLIPKSPDGQGRDPFAGMVTTDTDPAQVWNRPDRNREPRTRTPGSPDYGLDQPNPMDSGSAFADLDPGALGTIADNPDIAARYLARKRGNENGAPILSEAMRNALELSGMGLLGGARGMSSSGKRDLSSIPSSAGDKLRRAENWLDQMNADGTFPDPQAAYKKMFRRVRHTDPSLLSTGEGEAGDMENQINVTTGALINAAQAAGMDENNLGWLQAKLGQASQEYVMGVAEGSIDPVLMSYPNWLRSEKQAQRWLGR